jgi:hypothetical protein
MRALSLVFVLLLCSGCQTALKTAYGIKKPKLETTQSIKKYLVKQDIDTSNVYVLKDIKAFLSASQKKMLSIPDAIFFNKQGNLVRYKKETEDCNAKVDDFIAELENFSALPEDPNITMTEFLGMLEGGPINQKADINVFITWTVYAGRLNKTKAFEWIHLIEKAKAKGINANWYLLNCDYQKSWNLPPQALEKLGIKH